MKGRQKCPFKDSNVAGIILAMLCRVSGDHPSLTLFAKIEGVSELLICEPIGVSERSRTLRVRASHNDDASEIGRAHV